MAIGGEDVGNGFEGERHARGRVIGVDALLAILTGGEEKEEGIRDFSAEAEGRNDEGGIVPELGQVVLDGLERLGASRSKRPQMGSQ